MISLISTANKSNFMYFRYAMEVILESKYGDTVIYINSLPGDILFTFLELVNICNTFKCLLTGHQKVI